MEIVTTDASGASSSFRAFDTAISEKHEISTARRKSRFERLVERLHTFFIIGERDRMDQAVEDVVPLGQLAGEPFDLVRELDVADEHRRLTHERPHLLPPRRAANDIHHLGTGLHQHPADVPGHALAVGHAEHKDSFAVEL